MKIKWGNIFALGILICLVALLLRLPEIADRMSFSIGIPHYFDNPMIGLCFFGFVCLTIVAVAKILSDR
ncbi:MAG: hypothetical protein FVQ84_20725 [Planctomycetes bacterium]|nr:hypothetical protein [Planctomycetota bacterium]